MDSVNEKKIFKQFVYAKKLSFSEVLAKTKIPSNLLAYFLKKLLKKGVLQKSREGKYQLSSRGEKLLPFYTEQDSITPLVVLLPIVLDKDKVLLSKRIKRPYLGLWSILSGRMLLGDNIFLASERVCLEKAGIRARFKKTACVVCENFIEKEAKHSFVFFVTVMELAEPSKVKMPSNCKWFSLNSLPKNKMIASDYWIIKNKLNKEADVTEEVLQNQGKKMKLVNY